MIEIANIVKEVVWTPRFASNARARLAKVSHILSCCFRIVDVQDSVILVEFLEEKGPRCNSRLALPPNYQRMRCI